MFKVECPGCKAPYQVDERRVPAAGLGMRCPKCGSSFKVHRPEPTRPRMPTPADNAGLPASRDQSQVTGLPARKGALPAAIPNTMMGVAPSRKPSAPMMTAGSANQSLSDMEDDAFNLPDLPSPAGAPAVRRGEVGLPAVTGRPAQPSRGAPRAGEVALDFDLSPLPKGQGEDMGLPVPARAPAPPSAAAQARSGPPRPGPPRHSTAVSGAGPMFDESDFKAPQGLSVLPGQSGQMAASVSGLPAPAGQGAGLPAAQRAGLPASGAHLPASGANLPAAYAHGLPAPGGALPAPGGALPAPGGGLPSAADALPDLTDVDPFAPLPGAGDFAAAPGLDGDQLGGSSGHNTALDPFENPQDAFGEAEPGPDPFAAAAADPFVSAAPGGMPRDTAATGAPPFAPAGTVVYPEHANAPQTQSDPFSDVGPGAAGGSAFDTSAGEAPSFGDEADPFAADHAADPFGSSAGGSAFDTSGGESPFSTPPAERGDPFGDASASPFDTAAGIGDLDHPQPPPQAPGGDLSDGFDDDDDAAGVSRQEGGGGVDYGEVDLGGGDADSMFGESPGTDDGMEFGGVPQEDAPLGGPAEADVGGSALHARMAIGAMPEIETDRQRRRKRRMRVAVASGFVVLVAGGSLTLLPEVGPFGAFYILDRVQQGPNQRLLAQTQQRVRELRNADVFKGVNEMVETAVKASDKSSRFKALLAYAAYVRYWAALRFGPLFEMEARAKVVLAELETEKGLPKLALAQAAQALTEGRLGDSRRLLDTIPGGDADTDVISLRGELELRAHDIDKAEKAWSKMLEVSPGAQAAYGLARAVFERRDFKRALELANKTIEFSPEHLGARTLIARMRWDDGDEKSAVEALDFVVQRKGQASPGVLVAAYTWLGNIHLLRGRITQAEQAYNEALKLDARSGEALRGLGDTLYAAGRFNEALARFEAALEVDPASLSAAVGVGKTKVALERLEEAKAQLSKLYEDHKDDMNVAYWYGKVQEALGERDPARDAYARAIKAGGKKADSVKAYIALGNLQNQMGDVDGANATLAAAQNDLPESPELHKAMGRLALDQGRYDAAVTEFSRALELDAKDIEAKFALGTTYRRMRDFAQALSILDQVGKVDPNYPGYALERGLLYEQWGRIDEALKEYESALAKAPEDPDVMLRVGCARVGAGNGTGAEEILRKVEASRTQPAESSHCLGRALLLKGDYAEALRLLSRAVDMAPRRAEYHLYMGWAAQEQGRLAEALASIKKALDLDQSLADAYWQRGVIAHRQTALLQALDDLNYALKLRPSRVEAHAELAGVYYDMGQEQRSLQEWAIATSQNPSNMLWRFRYGKLLVDNLRYGEAINELNAAIDMAMKEEIKPQWLWQAHYYIARALGLNERAIEHWKAYLDQAPSDSPYRDEAIATLKKLGEPVRSY